MNSLKLIIRITKSADQLAKAFGIHDAHQVAALAGIISQELAKGQTEPQAYEKARLAAADLAARNNAQTSIDQLLEDLSRPHALVKRQALSHG